MTEPDDLFERRLRRSLDENARQAPDADAVTERLIAAARRAHDTGDTSTARRGPWSRWSLPLVAAACVAMIVGIVVAVTQTGDGPGRQAGRTSSLSAPASNATTKATSASPDATAGTSTLPSTASSSPISAGGLQNVSLVDFTFTDANHGWALAAADCLSGPGRCTALLDTTDGTTWQSHPNTPFDVDGVTAGCPAAKCVTNIRFANDTTGYAFGPDALFVTRDGAQSWHQLTGGAYALETLDDDVIRVVADHSGCPGPCNVRVETAAIGGAVWTPVTLPGGTVDAGTLALTRTGDYSFLTVSNRPAGSRYPVTLFTSADGGASWTKRPDPCTTYAGASVVTQNLATAADGSASVLCAGTWGSDKSIITSTDGGASFGAPVTVTGAGVLPSSAHGEGLGSIGALSGRVLVGYGVNGLYRSADGGHTWRQVVTDTADGNVVPPGFETTTVGRWVSPDARTIWTTRDAGRTWTSYSLG